MTIYTRLLGWVFITFELRMGKRDGNEVWHWAAARADLLPPALSEDITLPHQ
ncbi:hypothetical protein [Pseudacidovorax intermedius]|uniref:hypothetical protein n=1 Tax=Pseudacidovorax intermedius TaxID=433924 RepID=UPI00187C6040|nr:hypothetical protein [Pseudacidovorax intermedius]